MMGAREWIALAALALALIGFAAKATLAAGRTLQSIDSLRAEMADSLAGIRDTMKAVRSLADEGLRQARAAHSRVDRLEEQTARLDRRFARMDERTRHWLKTTQKIRGEVDDEVG
jgi:DNA-binding transcriptional MerR regulator